MLNNVLMVFFVYNVVFVIIFLLYQFEILDMSENIMIWWCRANSIFETIIFVATRFGDFSQLGTFSLGGFYIISIIVLILQFVFAQFSIGRKLLDLLWIGFYVTLFMVDICDMTLVEIFRWVNFEGLAAVDNFLANSFVGKLLISIIAPVCHQLLIEAIHRKTN